MNETRHIHSQTSQISKETSAKKVNTVYKHIPVYKTHQDKLDQFEFAFPEAPFFLC